MSFDAFLLCIVLLALLAGTIVGVCSLNSRD